MNCPEVSAGLNSYLDNECESQFCRVVEEHLRHCPDCTRQLEELALVQGALSASEGLSEIGEQRIWREVRRGLRETWISRAGRALTSLAAYWRDLDRRFVWSKVVAAPLVLFFFALLSMHFPSYRTDELSFSAIRLAANDHTTSNLVRVFTLDAKQSTASTNNLMETIWRMSYEDSLSLVAEIQPEGHLQVDSVLEYPRNPVLLQVIDDNLRTSQFASAGLDKNSLVIYSFQKVDVYEEGL